MMTMQRSFTFTGLVYVALFAMIGLGLGSMYHALTPKLAGAAPAVVTDGTSSNLPAITSVTATTGGWNVQLNNGTTLFVETRQVSTGGKAPAIAQLRAFDDQACVLGSCAGYANLIDADGQAYAGYRKK